MCSSNGVRPATKAVSPQIENSNFMNYKNSRNSRTLKRILKPVATNSQCNDSRYILNQGNVSVGNNFGSFLCQTKCPSEPTRRPFTLVHYVTGPTDLLIYIGGSPFHVYAYAYTFDMCTNKLYLLTLHEGSRHVYVRQRSGDKDMTLVE